MGRPRPLKRVATSAALPTISATSASGDEAPEPAVSRNPLCAFMQSSKHRERRDQILHKDRILGREGTEAGKGPLCTTHVDILRMPRRFPTVTTPPRPEQLGTGQSLPRRAAPA